MKMKRNRIGTYVSSDVFTEFVFFFGVGFDFVVGADVFTSVVVEDDGCVLNRNSLKAK